MSSAISSHQDFYQVLYLTRIFNRHTLILLLVEGMNQKIKPEHILGLGLCEAYHIYIVFKYWINEP